jgi:hypothetical protein
MSREVLTSSNDVMIMTGRDVLEAAMEKCSRDHKALLVIDLSGADSAARADYLGAVKAAEVVTDEQLSDSLSGGAAVIAVPFYTVSFAAEAYRRIKHARHFVTLWVDGKKYALES